MLPQRIPNPFSEDVGFEDICFFAARWGLEVDLVTRITNSQAELPFELWMFSGARSRGEHEAVSETPFDVSTHADNDLDGCERLATGADVQPVSPAIRITELAVAQMGAAFTRNRLRWGGGAPVTDRGIPVGNERWHVDLGARPS